MQTMTKENLVTVLSDSIKIEIEEDENNVYLRVLEKDPESIHLFILNSLTLKKARELSLTMEGNSEYL